MKSFESRDSIDNKYKWDLSHLYQSPKDWEDKFEEAKELIDGFPVSNSELFKSKEAFRGLIDKEEKLSELFGRLYLYAFLSKDVDMSNEEALQRFGKIQSLASELGQKTSYIEPNLLALEESELKELFDGISKTDYRQYLDNLIRKKAHTLSDKEEKIISASSNLRSAAYNTFSLLKSTDIDFPTIEVEGKETKLSDGQYSALMYNKHEPTREKAYREYYKPYIAHKNTLASLLDTSIKSFGFIAKTRNYKSNLYSSLHSNNIPESLFDKAIEQSIRLAPMLQMWAKIKAKKLKKKTISPFDTYVSLFDDSDTEYGYDENITNVLNSLKPLGDDYLTKVKEAIDKNRIDVYETKGKRSGAYSSGTTYGAPPYVLLNWKGTLNDVFTFTHEIGHNMHSVYTEESQPQVYAGYSIFLAEVASITNEALLHKYMESNSDSTEEKLRLHELFLNKCLTTFFRQLQFAYFEKEIHQTVSSGTPLTPKYLSDTYEKIFKKYWSDSVIAEPEEAYSWTRIPHFYYNFYVFQYATGLAAGEYLAEAIIKDGKNSIGKYLDFLKAGRSKYPVDLMAETGADLREDYLYDNLENKMRESLEYIEANI
ncbi:MAG: oligoendopeptidase F [Candidatus Kapaibacteriales bacterium]